MCAELPLNMLALAVVEEVEEGLAVASLHASEATANHAVQDPGQLRSLKDKWPVRLINFLQLPFFAYALLNVWQVWTPRAHGAQDCGGESLLSYQLAGENDAHTNTLAQSTTLSTLPLTKIVFHLATVRRLKGRSLFTFCGNFVIPFYDKYDSSL